LYSPVSLRFSKKQKVIRRFTLNAASADQNGYVARLFNPMPLSMVATSKALAVIFDVKDALCIFGCR